MATKRILPTAISSFARISSPVAASITRSARLHPQRFTLQKRTAWAQLPSAVRFQHTKSSPASAEDTSSEPAPAPSVPIVSSDPWPSESVRKAPHYELTFTCKPCSKRSRHKISKQGYHHGSVLVTCPGCRSKHVITDHLRIFGDHKITIEELLAERGQIIKKGTLGPDGDIEFWEDGTVTTRGEDVPEEKRVAIEDDDSPPGSTFVSVKPPKKEE
ncbi:DNL zinc finger-domain-containing protein [Lasiosphaeria hispida]|uniref:DNL zinc finger-domain-containing protein n=1 Tax=Lasiosphaeria hispida TaxID=260671 RepID=A0AAJ0HT09_9PEZI|nr:DNL zinc finger-domain-containing protein [Lasiosphaeria hispida]